MESEWIKVADKFPEVCEWYLAFSEGQIQMLFLDCVEPLLKDSLLWLSPEGDWDHEVTHWKTLPPPPVDSAEGE